MSSRQGRILSRNYSLVALASGVPLLVIVLVLAVFQFTTQRDQLLSELENDATGHNVLLSSVVKSVHDYILSLGTWAELYGEEQPNRKGSVAAGLWTAFDARLITVGDAVPERAGAEAEIGLAASLVPHMRLAHRTMPYLRWSYYLSGQKDLFSVYPVLDGHAFGGRMRHATRDQILSFMFEYDLFARAGVPSADSATGTYWTDAYDDPAGAGWVVAHGLPVHYDGGGTGVIGTAVLLDFLTGFLRAFDYPCGRLWLVNPAGEILAASDGRTMFGSDLLRLKDVLPPGLQGLALEQLSAPSTSFRQLADTYVMSQTVGSAPWHLLFVVSQGELNRVLLPRILPYGVILVGLLLTLLLAQQLRRRVLIRPALSLLEFIRAESQELQPQKPHVPSAWRPWLDAVADAFEAKRASLAQVRDSALHFRTIAESHPVPVCIVRLADRTILHASQAFAEMYGIALEELRGLDTARFYADLDDRARLLRQLRDGGGYVQGFEAMARRADGSLFPAALTSQLIEFEGGPAIVSAVLDLSEQKRAEAEIARQREALRQSEQRFRTIAEAHPVPMAIVRRADRRIVYANQRFAELTGMSLDQILEHTSSFFFPDEHDRECTSQTLREHGSMQDFETVARRHDGSLFPVAVSARLITYEGEQAGVFGLVDLTDKKLAEEEISRQREALHQSEKLNALGSMLANVAHELNNPLSVVVGYASMMRDLAPDEASKERAVRIHAAAERCARIVRTFLAMARRKPEARRAVDLNQIVEGALEVAGYGLRTTDISVSFDLDPKLPEITADADQLTLVVMNLIVNAQHALQTVSPPRRLEIATRRANGEIVLEVIDNGPGIPDEIRHRIFEPFFTTKPQGIGTGIGLSVCRNAINAHGGEIKVDSSSGQGTRFTVRLPIGDAEAMPAECDAEVAAQATAGRILIVEDEVEIADMLDEMLARDGHEVLLAQSGREALELLEDTRVDLIISDLHMPDIDGQELYRELVQRRPDCADRMMFMTGDVLGAEITGFLSETELPVFDKPIDPYEIRARVRTQLSARA